MTAQIARGLVLPAALTSVAACAAMLLTSGTATVHTTPARVTELKCDLTQYKASAGLTATLDQATLVVALEGRGGSEVRARYAVGCKRYLRGGSSSRFDGAVQQTGIPDARHGGGNRAGSVLHQAHRAVSDHR